MTFVRLQGCHVGCTWCDTAHSWKKTTPKARVESPPRSSQFQQFENPVLAEQLNQFLKPFTDEIISITGGEPLEQADFLAEWLPTAGTRRILLETAGIHTAALKKVLPWIDIVSMDFKLPSSTGLKPFWKEHTAFLQTAVEAKKEIYIKIVITKETKQEEIEKASQMISGIDSKISVFCQPTSPAAGMDLRPSADLLKKFQRHLLQRCTTVEIRGQLHKEWNLL